MQRITKKDLPSWLYELNKDKHYLVLSDDLDSLLSCSLLSERFGVEIGAFYSFSEIVENKEITRGKIPVYVDIDTNEGLCLGNHPTVGAWNKDSINLNKFIKYDNYHSKYSGSVYSMLLWLLDVDLNEFTMQQIIISIIVDSHFKGFYDSKFKSSWLHWNIDVMRMTRFKNLVYQVQESGFKNVSFKYQTKAKITLDSEGRLQTKINLKKLNELGFNVSLPDTKFTTVTKRLFNCREHITTVEYLQKEENLKMFSNARTYKDTVKFSLEELEHDKLQNHIEMMRIFNSV